MGSVVFFGKIAERPKHSSLVHKSTLARLSSAKRLTGSSSQLMLQFGYGELFRVARRGQSESGCHSLKIVKCHVLDPFANYQSGPRDIDNGEIGKILETELAPVRG